MNDDTARHEAELEEQARRRTQDLIAEEEAAQRAAVMDERRSPDAESAEVPPTAPQHDHADTAAYHHQPAPVARRRRGPRR